MPALARLQADGLLRTSEPGARGSRNFEITSAGVKALKRDWPNAVDRSVSDAEALLRTAYLAWKYGSPSKARKVLESAAANAAGMANVARAEAERFRASIGTVNTDAHRWLRARLEAARLEAQAEAFEALASELEALRGEDTRCNPGRLRPRNRRRCK